MSERGTLTPEAYKELLASLDRTLAELRRERIKLERDKRKRQKSS